MILAVTATTDLPKLKAFAMSLIRYLRASNCDAVRVGIVSFNTDAHVESELTSDTAKAMNAVDALIHRSASVPFSGRAILLVWVI